MKTKFEIVLELYKQGHVTAEECSILMQKEKETVYLGYPSFYNTYPQSNFPLIQKPFIDLSPYYYSNGTDLVGNTNSVTNDKPEI